MKKIVLIALTLLVTGTMFADKKCCKDSAKCKKEMASKSCTHGGGTAVASTEAAATTEMKPCCKRSVAAGGKPCCAQGAHADASKAKADAPAPAKSTK